MISAIRLIPHIQKILDFSPVIRYSDLFLLFGTEEDRHYGIDRWAKLFKTKTWEDFAGTSGNNSVMDNAGYYKNMKTII